MPQMTSWPCELLTHVKGLWWITGDSILAIVTLAAPQQQAPANVHAALHAFYYSLQRAAQLPNILAMAADNSTNGSTGLMPLLSIAGGECSSRASCGSAITAFKYVAIAAFVYVSRF